LAFLAGDKGKAFADATADVVEVGGAAVGFQQIGSLGEGAKESEVDRPPIDPGLGIWLKPEVNEAGFA